MPEDMLAWGLGAHAVVLPLSLAGLYRYSDRSNLFKKSLGDTDDLLARMRTKVASAIEEELAPVFRRAEGEPRIVSPHGYSERPTDPVSSDAFREAIHRFVHSEVDALADYEQVYRSRNRWCHWARMLSWTVLVLSFWEVVCVAVLGLLAKFFGIQIADGVVAGSFAPTTVLVLNFFICKAVLLRQQDVIHDYKINHPEL